MSDTRRPSSALPFLLVHGAWHGAWTYERIIPLLAARGHAAVACDLPAHGLNARFPATYLEQPQRPAKLATETSPVAGVTLNDYVDATLATLQRLRGLGYDKVVLVAHSMGGIVASAVAERAPEAIAHLVYLTAFMPESGVPAVSYIDAPENEGQRVGGLFVADPSAVGALRINHRSADEAYRAASKAAFYGDVDDIAYAAVANLLTPDVPVAPFATPVATTAARWGAVPRHYIRCLQDQAIRPALQQRFIAAADAFVPAHPTRVHTLDASHSPFMSQPQALATLLADIAES